MNETSWDKLAENYHSFVISPFQKDVKNPLIDDIKKVSNRKEKIVAEFGCGRFELGKFLSKNFKKIYAYDFSKGMIKKARDNNPFSNVEITKLDTTKLDILEKFDIAISVNSLLMDSFEKIKESLKNIYFSLKKGGEFFMIAPSMESILYEGMLILNRESIKKSEKIARNSTKRIAENNKYDYFLGYYKDGKDTQKFFYLHELVFLLEKTGFKKLIIKKVEYPWKKEISDYENFPEERPLWDWFIRCKKD